MNHDTLTLNGDTTTVDNDIDNSFDDLNGNWDDIRDRLADQFRGDDDNSVLVKSIEANARAAQMALFGGLVQLDDSAQNRSMVSTPVRGGTVVRAFWWGFHIQVSHQDVQELINAFDGVQALLQAIGPVVPGVVRPFLAVAGIFLDVSKNVLRAVDRGRGVYISMSWFAPGIFVPTSV